MGDSAGHYTHEDCYAIEHLQPRSVSFACFFEELFLLCICEFCLKLGIYSFEDISAGDTMLVIDFDEAVLDSSIFNRHTSEVFTQRRGVSR